MFTKTSLKASRWGQSGSSGSRANIAPMREGCPSTQPGHCCLDVDSGRVAWRHLKGMRCSETPERLCVIPDKAASHWSPGWGRRHLCRGGSGPVEGSVWKSQKCPKKGVRIKDHLHISCMNQLCEKFITLSFSVSFNFTLEKNHMLRFWSHYLDPFWKLPTNWFS